MTMRVYLSGEIHTDWRDQIIAGAAGLDVVSLAQSLIMRPATIVVLRSWEKKMTNSGMTTRAQG